VRTSRWNKTVYDPYNNLLRNTVEAFAGVLGGCESMQVGAFDEVIRRPDDFSQRLARNTQLILQGECQLEHVIDPVGGSWYVESMTSQAASKAWSLFQDVEKLGGMAAALQVGFPQKIAANTAAERIASVTRRRSSVIGINQYANPGEKRLEAQPVDATSFHKRRVQQVAGHRTSMEDEASANVLEKLAKVVENRRTGLFEDCVDAVSAGATIGEVTRALRINDTPCRPITAVSITRAAEPFEHLRAAVDRYASRGNQRPQVFLCNMGSAKEHKARADFSSGFFAVGGYEVVSPPGFESPEAAARAWAQTNARIVVICSTDEKYPELVPPLAAALRKQRPEAIIVLAGYPPDQAEAHKRAGVDEFIHARADAAELLARFHQRLAINE
jgi:methylmalonyl-CoA mutase